MTETVMIALSCVLFVGMGLAGAIQEYIPFRLRIMTCPKCLTFWSVLIYSLFSGEGVIQSIAVSFIISYISLWAALLLDALTILYNMLYEKITRNQRTADEERPEADKEGTASDNADI